VDQFSGSGGDLQTNPILKGPFSLFATVTLKMFHNEIHLLVENDQQLVCFKPIC